MFIHKHTFQTWSRQVSTLTLSMYICTPQLDSNVLVENSNLQNDHLDTSKIYVSCQMSTRRYGYELKCSYVSCDQVELSKYAFSNWSAHLSAETVFECLFIYYVFYIYMSLYILCLLYIREST